MKKYLNIRIVMLVVLIISINFSHAENVPVTTEEPLSTAMQATGAEISEVNVNGWTKLAINDASDEDLEDAVKEAMSGFGITKENYKITRSATRYQRIVKAEALLRNMHIVAAAQQLKSLDKTKEPEVYLVINVDSKSQDEITIKDLNTKFANIMENFGGTPHITTCLVGWLDGKLVKDEQDKRLKDAFASVNARIITANTSAQYTSSTGFSPLIINQLKVGSDEININIAMRYSPYDNRTYVIIGSPVITMEY
ncbi:YwmB family TATA-box binding protein [Dendrosporobacter sp. 1207_IL3150]|uniref:YwmB family TATA-box binding protein n=1 Tax=Dendrosporobacter sp. 1207_IL3150 TaxID=3084054 RepID=UPI002FD8FFAC